MDKAATPNQTTEEKDFTQKCLTSILPWIEDMIKNEENFRESLIKGKDDIINGKRKFLWLKIFRTDRTRLIAHLDRSIAECDKVLNGLYNSRKEYQDFVLKNW